MQQVTLKKIASLVKGECRGNEDRVIEGITPIHDGRSGTITFLHSSQYKKYLATTKASAVILTEKDSKDCFVDKIIVPDPYLAFAMLSELFCEKPVIITGVQSSAHLDENVNIPASASVGHNAVIQSGTLIGENTFIGASVFIGTNVRIGTNCWIHPNTTIYNNVTIGNNVIIHSGTVIGADGFGYARKDDKWVKIYQLGKVVIHDNVEIGANSTVDCGALGDTIIGQGVKIDNQVQIGHNVTIGDHTIIAGCSAIAGSTTIGKNCMIGGAVSVNGHISITDGVIITGTSIVGGTITEPGMYSSGVVAEKSSKWKRIGFYIKNLDKYIDIIKKLDKEKNNLD